MLLKLRQPCFQSHCIQLVDGKNANTALTASWTAHQPFATFPRGFGQS
jgi:hypothetical protein